MSELKKQSALKSPWVIGWLLLVLTVLAVNGFMIIKAINNNPGLVVEDFYERGQDYEENILSKLKNNQQWTTQFTLSEIHVNKPTAIDFSINDANGKPARVEKITLFVYRPADKEKDFSATMKLKEDGKSYQANLIFNHKGKWDIVVSVIIEGVEVNYGKSIFVKD